MEYGQGDVSPAITPGVDGLGLMITVIVFDVAGEPATHGALVDKIQFTTSPLFSDEETYNELLLPTFCPFTRH